ncbi:MAG: polysaccharide deacetylase family protein [Actinomycetes bacterium]
MPRPSRAAKDRLRTLAYCLTAAVLTAVAGLTGCVGGDNQPEWAVTSTTTAPSTDRAATDTDPTPTSNSSTTTLPASTTPTSSPASLRAPRPAAPVVLPAEPGLAPVVSRVPTSDRVIFLTIDDGIWRLPGVAEKLHELGIPFTSFLTQPYARQDPGYWRRTLELGGTVQGHTTNHPNLSTTSPRRTLLEVCSTRQPFEELFGQPQTLFRPPYGVVTETVRRVAAGCGFRAVVLWKGTLNNGVLALQDRQLQPGDIILMHYRPQAFADIQAVALTALAQGFRFGLLEDYLVGPTPTPSPSPASDGAP